MVRVLDRTGAVRATTRARRGRGGHAVMSIRVLGLGNDLLADDAPGARGRIRARPPIRRAGRGRLLVHVGLRPARRGGRGLRGCSCSTRSPTGAAPPGTLFEVREDEVAGAARRVAALRRPVRGARLGRALGLDVPSEVVILAVEPEDVLTVGGPMSGTVAGTLEPLLERASAIVTGGSPPTRPSHRQERVPVMPSSTDTIPDARAEPDHAGCVSGRAGPGGGVHAGRRTRASSAGGFGTSGKPTSAGPSGSCRSPAARSCTPASSAAPARRPARCRSTWTSRPRRIIQLVREGFRHDALRSQTIWLCASCYACAVHCPQDIHITDVMYTLKREAIAREAVARSASRSRCWPASSTTWCAATAAPPSSGSCCG